MRLRPALLVLAAACAAPSTQPADPLLDGGPVRPHTVVDDVVEESNRVRVQNGAQRLTVHPALERTAASHAQELLRRRVLDHESDDPARRTLAQRLALEDITAWRRIGENLATVLNPQLGPAREIVRLWLGSPGHRANLLERGFEETGVGAARAPDGTWYVVQVYGSGIETR